MPRLRPGLERCPVPLAMPRKTYHVYVLTNRSRTTLYVGATSDLRRRMAQHRAGTFAGAFTTRYRLTGLVYAERFDTPSEMVRRERQVKGWRRAKKVALVNAANPSWADLARTPGGT